MFEHLDDVQPPRSGTEAQLSAARTGGRLLMRQRRRSRLAAGSVALATTAGVSAIAAVGLPGGAGAVSTSAAGDAAPTTVAAPPTTVAAAPPTTAAAPPTTVAAAPPTTAVAAPPTTAAAGPTTAPVKTAACLAEAAGLLKSVEPAGYVRTDAGTAVIAWDNAAGPLTHLVVDVACAPFAASDVPAAQGPVKLVTVLDAHHWVIGTAASGHLREVWNADNGTAVTIDATVASSTDETTAENELSTFGNYLLD